MKDLGQSGWAWGEAIIITSEAAAAQPPCLSLSSGLWLRGKGRDDSTRPGAAAQVFQREARKGGFGRSGLPGERRGRREEGGTKRHGPASEPPTPGFNLLWEAFPSQSPHTGIKTQPSPPSPTRSTFHSPTPVGVRRHVLLLPINNSRWLCKPRGKVLVSVDMQFDLLLSGGKTRKEWHPLEARRRGFSSCRQRRPGSAWGGGTGGGGYDLGGGYADHHTTRPHPLSKKNLKSLCYPVQGQKAARGLSFPFSGE